MSEKNTHEGHRSRLRKRYLDSGLDGFEDHEILEMVLYNCYTRRNTNDIAHKLLDNFGSISAVFEAPVDALVGCGISESVASYLHMIPDICRVYFDDRNKSKSKIISMDSIGAYFVNKYIGRSEECIYLLLLDSKCKEIFCGVVSKGTTISSDVSMRKIVDLSMRYNATYAVISHNHPSGVAIPSREDVAMTFAVHNVLDSIGVQLVDHIIVADDEYLSFREESVCSVFENGK